MKTVKKFMFAVVTLLGASAQAFAGPLDDFTTFNGGLGGDLGTSSVTTAGGIVIDGFVYAGGTTYDQTQGTLWLRNNEDDRGLGYCSTGETCSYPDTGNPGGIGLGDNNEISNNFNNEVIRLTLNGGQNPKWGDIWVSSLDTGGTNGNETGTIYWSNSANADLSTAASFTFSNNSLGWGDSQSEGSIYSAISGAAGWDADAKYLYFRAGPVNGTDNDYLVWGVTAVPEPETYAMLFAGLGLLGFVARRRRAHA